MPERAGGVPVVYQSFSVRKSKLQRQSALHYLPLWITASRKGLLSQGVVCQVAGVYS
jgi:hypothetical protein